MDWKKLFDQEILERGYGYYCKNTVENLDVSSDVILADVAGSEDYEVEISLNRGEIADMYCSCPYAEDGNNCKHMAAVLYAWEERGEKADTPKADVKEEEILFMKARTKEACSKKQDAIQKFVEKADISTVISYLTSVFMKDEKLLLRFYNTVSRQMPKKDFGDYKKQVDRILDSYIGKERYRDYNEVCGFTDEIDDIIDKDVSLMISKKQYMSAFELINYICKSIGNVNIYDFDNEIDMIMNSIYQLWMTLLKKVNAEEKQEMFHWFISHMDDSVGYYYIEQIIMGEFKEKKYQKQKLLLIEEILDKEIKKNSGQSKNYCIGKWAIRYIDLLKQEKASQQQIKEFCKKYWENSSVRKYYVDMCMKNKEYEQALAVLDESIDKDKGYGNLVSEYIKMKKEIYLLQGNREAYTEQLWELLLKYEIGNMEIYRELKKQYGEDEWLQKREEIFNELSGYIYVERLYQEKKLYDRLLKSVLKYNGLYKLRSYVSVLKKDYPEQILKKYRQELNQMASNTGTRKQYQEMVDLLREMQEIKGGSEVVKEMVAEWRKAYPNRPAMMDELNKLQERNR